MQRPPGLKRHTHTDAHTDTHTHTHARKHTHTHTYMPLVVLNSTKRARKYWEVFGSLFLIIGYVNRVITPSGPARPGPRTKSVRWHFEKNIYDTANVVNHGLDPFILVALGIMGRLKWPDWSIWLPIVIDVGVLMTITRGR